MRAQTVMLPGIWVRNLMLANKEDMSMTKSWSVENFHRSSTWQGNQFSVVTMFMVHTHLPNLGSLLKALRIIQRIIHSPPT